MPVAVQHLERTHRVLVRLFELGGPIQRLPGAQLEDHLLFDLPAAAERREQLIGGLLIAVAQRLEGVHLLAELIERIVIGRGDGAR